MRQLKITRKNDLTWTRFRVGSIEEAGQAVQGLLTVDVASHEVTWLQVTRRQGKGRAVTVNVCWAERSRGNTAPAVDEGWRVLIESVLDELGIEMLGDDQEFVRPRGVR